MALQTKFSYGLLWKSEDPHCLEFYRDNIEIINTYGFVYLEVEAYILGQNE